MGVTYVSATDRDAWRNVEIGWRLGERHLVLVITSILAALAIALSYGGRLVAQRHAETSQQSARAINLNVVTNAQELESRFDPIFTNAHDRRFAAERVLEFIVVNRRSGISLPNVGAILRATATPDAIQRAPVVEYKERLQQALEKAKATGGPPPVSIPVLTSSELALLKPSVVVRTDATLARLTLLWATIYLASVWAVPLFWWARGVRGDYLLLAATHLLTAIGFAAVLSRQDALRDTLLFIRYTQGVSIGLVAFAGLSVLDFRKTAYLTLSYVPLVAALFLSVMLIVFGDGPGGSNAKVNFGPVQPIEAIRLLLALFLAGYFARRWELLRQVRARNIRDVRVPGWLDLPKLDYVLPVLAGVTAALIFFFLQKDLGPALFISCVFLAMYAIARNRVGMAIFGLSLLVAGFYLGYKLNISTTLAARVQIWQSPWDNGARGGDQIAQAIWAFSTGGLSGTGLGLGDARYLPAGHTDLVLAAIGEELGFVGLLCVACVFIIIAARGFITGLRAGNDYGFFLATAVTLFLALPVLLMAAGMLGVVPMTGVVTPFLSYGGSAMVANFAALGVLTAIGSNSEFDAAATPFRAATKSLIALLGIATFGVVVALVNIQVLQADDFVVKPHLGIQSDGIRRFQYNQRVLDVVATIPRGTVYDRRGLPLATGDRTIARSARDQYRTHGIDVPGCPAALEERCYPLAGATFHLLGDASSRRNWTASNTSYVERNAQDRLRGFDDHATAEKTTDLSGQSLVTIRRDYRELIPLLRHRYQPDHPEVKAFLDRTRDVTVTIDAPLQARVARILSKYAAQSATGHAAAIVLDPDNGQLLAIGSYPFPGAEGNENGESPSTGSGRSDPVEGRGSDPEMLLDRARYGLYPPGSTFKLVTAAAALRRDAASSRAKFECTEQPNGRVGMRIPGWGVVRDDVLDKHPHGTIDMHDGLVRSCNAYFAQLAVRVGPHQIFDTATMLGISVARDNSIARLKTTLPQAGYGQGDVVATPLRMARVAGAIASKGILRDPLLDSGAPEPAQYQRLLTPDAAALLGQYLRDAVLTGTGRSLRAHEWKIAGKTGTAEIAGAKSHAWFTGFAPYGPAEKRIAFAVIIENAGYGGLAAAPAAGEIVSAAAASGLIR